MNKQNPEKTDSNPFRVMEPLAYLKKEMKENNGLVCHSNTEISKITGVPKWIVDNLTRSNNIIPGLSTDFNKTIDGEPVNKQDMASVMSYLDADVMYSMLRLNTKNPVEIAQDIEVHSSAVKRSIRRVEARMNCRTKKYEPAIIMMWMDYLDEVKPDWTKVDLAKLIGVGQTSIQHWEQRFMEDGYGQIKSAASQKKIEVNILHTFINKGIDDETEQHREDIQKETKNKNHKREDPRTRNIGYDPNQKTEVDLDALYRIEFPGLG